MLYLASGYEERVGELFESRMTWLNAWKGAPVQRMHVRAKMGTRLRVHEHARAWQGVRHTGRCSAARQERGRAGRATGGRAGRCYTHGDGCTVKALNAKPEPESDKCKKGFRKDTDVCLVKRKEIARSTGACPAKGEEIARSLGAYPAEGEEIARSTGTCPAEGEEIARSTGACPGEGRRDCKKHESLPGG
ncbi:hypothetical protein CRG98_040704 [Punica granatum]|uniref:Uncharacterized protein n=1 Tax=Punica granatum TaxID=22663 RepID=A0A2I0I4P1_PUNGR|nr:hypothetical protein CRG98_040704 [Punica granatum]